jgi:hypothetical protein
MKGARFTIPTPALLAKVVEARLRHRPKTPVIVVLQAARRCAKWKPVRGRRVSTAVAMARW